MSPIKDMSDIVRIPRLGKVRLGIKVPGSKEKSPYPRATDYFVCPDEVQKVFGEKPTELEIMFPVEDPGQFAQQWLRCYSSTQGLVCIGDGETSRRKVDLTTGDIAGRDTKQWEWKDELPCNPEECPHYSKQCRRVMNLLFLLPKVPGLGVWQIDTSSFYSIVNINSMIKMLKGVLGRCSMIPLTLALGPIEVTPRGMTKKTVHVMHIKKDIKLADLAKLTLLPPAQVLIPEPEVEEPPEDLYPSEVLEEAETRKEEESELSSELPQDNRLILWSNIRSLLGSLKPKPKDDIITKWFLDHYLVEVKSEVFNQGQPPEELTEKILDHFHNSLLAYEANLRKK
jgi:hypothetical protein